MKNSSEGEAGGEPYIRGTTKNVSLSVWEEIEKMRTAGKGKKWGAQELRVKEKGSKRSSEGCEERVYEEKGK